MFRFWFRGNAACGTTQANSMLNLGRTQKKASCALPRRQRSHQTSTNGANDLVFAPTEGGWQMTRVRRRSCDERSSTLPSIGYSADGRHGENPPSRPVAMGRARVCNRFRSSWTKCHEERRSLVMSHPSPETSPAAGIITRRPCGWRGSFPSRKISHRSAGWPGPGECPRNHVPATWAAPASGP